MRTSLSQQIQNSLSYINLSSNSLTDMQNRASSGKRILRASDDVLGTSRVLTLKSDIQNNEQLSNNITVIEPMLKSTSAALNDIVKALGVIQTKAIASNNDSLTDVARTQLAQDIDDQLGIIMNAANTKHLDKYVFSGTATTTQPITQQVGTPAFTYDGNDEVRQTRILPMVSTPTNIAGSKLFNFDGGAGAGVPDVFTMVKQIKDAILAGDDDAVSSQLSNIEANTDNILSCSAQVGSWTARMDNASNVLSNSNIQLKSMLSDTQDIDIAEAIIQLKTQENVYQAALSISTQVLNMSLASLKAS